MVPYSSESIQLKLSDDYQHDRVYMVLQKTLHPCALDESSLSIGRVKLENCLHIFKAVFTIQ